MKFGDTITVDAVYRRRLRVHERQTNEKFWDARAIKPREGIYIGQRTLSNGLRWFEDEVGMVYEPKHYFRAALVVFNERENPVLVPIESP